MEFGNWMETGIEARNETKVTTRKHKSIGFVECAVDPWAFGLYFGGSLFDQIHET
jgi:hypothetical protein